MKTKTIYLYEFKELPEEAKQKAIDNWYEHEDYPFLEDDLTESLKALLEQNKIKYDNTLELHYSLDYCQGDGTCFMGKFRWKNYSISIEKRNSHYYHKYSTDIYIETNYGNETKEKVYEKFKKIYYNICDEIKKEGYGTLEYRMNEEEFNELCEANNYTFLKDGTMENE